MRRVTQVVTAGLAAAAAALAVVPAAGAASGTREVLYVGNNWDGTAHIVDPVTFKTLGRLNIVPDRRRREIEVFTNPVRAGFFLGIRQLVGEGHDQFVDDLFSSRDGRFLYVSRPSFADVVAIDLRTRKIVWRISVDGQRTDHMAISPDGRYLAVSASTARKVHIINTDLGKLVGEFPSGDQPHENNFSADGKLIYHASIGSVFTPLDQPSMDATKGERVFQIVDARTFKVLKRIDMGKKLDEFGEPDMSGAVRPMALSPDEKTLYFQVSFFHGFIEYDLERDRVTRLARLPLSAQAKRTPREGYLLDSAHHGLSMNPEGTKLCAAGTMSDYAAIVNRRTFGYRIAAKGAKPYWSTNSGDGRYCFVSFSGDDAVGVVSYASEKEIARFPVGDHPQRMRIGRIESAAVSNPTPLSLRGLRLSRKRFRSARGGRAVAPPGRRLGRRVGTRVRYRLGGDATVTLRVQRARRARGRLVGGRCVRRRRSNASRRKCTRYRTLRGKVTDRGAQGVNRLRLTGRWRGKRLRRGRYRLIARARDRAGNRSRQARARFRIVRR